MVVTSLEGLNTGEAGMSKAHLGIMLQTSHHTQGSHK